MFPRVSHLESILTQIRVRNAWRPYPCDSLYRIRHLRVNRDVSVIVIETRRQTPRRIV